MLARRRRPRWTRSARVDHRPPRPAGAADHNRARSRWTRLHPDRHPRARPGTDPRVRTRRARDDDPRVLNRGRRGMGRPACGPAVHRRRPPRGPGPPGLPGVAAAPGAGARARVGRPRRFPPWARGGRRRPRREARGHPAGRAGHFGDHWTRAPEGTGTRDGADPVKLSAVIMAHPVRKDSAERVHASLDRDVEIVYDQVTQPSADPRQRWAVGRRCWQAADPSADWHLVIQDDALVCQDLLAGLEKALDVIGPEGLVSAYTGTGRPNQYNVRRAHRHAQDKGHSWMPTKSLCWGVAILAPVPTIPDMVKWCSHSSKAQLKYDMRV